MHLSQTSSEMDDCISSHKTLLEEQEESALSESFLQWNNVFKI